MNTMDEWMLIIVYLNLFIFSVVVTNHLLSTTSDSTFLKIKNIELWCELFLHLRITNWNQFSYKINPISTKFDFQIVIEPQKNAKKNNQFLVWNFQMVWLNWRHKLTRFFLREMKICHIKLKSINEFFEINSMEPQNMTTIIRHTFICWIIY